MAALLVCFGAVSGSVHGRAVRFHSNFSASDVRNHALVRHCESVDQDMRAFASTSCQVTLHCAANRCYLNPARANCFGLL